MLLDHLYDLLEVVVGVLVVVKSIGQLFQRLKEAIQVHLVVVTSTHHILVDDIIVCFKYMIIG